MLGHKCTIELRLPDILFLVMLGKDLGHRLISGALLKISLSVAPEEGDENHDKDYCDNSNNNSCNCSSLYSPIVGCNVIG